MNQTFRACYYDTRIEHVSLEKTSAFLNDRKQNPVIIVTDGEKVCPEPALFLGVSYSGPWDSPQYFDFLKKTYPNSYLYTTWSDELIFWDDAIDISTILKKNKQALVYISGADSATEASILSRVCNGMLQKNEIACSKIYSSENKYENIYLLKAALH